MKNKIIIILTSLTVLFAPSCLFSKIHRIEPKQVKHIIKKHHKNTKLVKAIITVESNWRPNAVSPKGAVGLMQVLPSSAKWMGLNYSKNELLQPENNIEAGCKILRYYQKKSRNLDEALHKYSGGARNYSTKVREVMASL